MKTDFSTPVATAEFSKFAGILSAALSQHHLPGFEIARLIGGAQITSTSFVHSDAFQGPLDFTFQDVWLCQISDHTIMIILVVKIFFVQFFCVFLPPLNIFCFC